jgi:hypothetical protein
MRICEKKEKREQREKRRKQRIAWSTTAHHRMEYNGNIR